MERATKPLLTPETLRKIVKNCKNLGVSRLELSIEGVKVEFFDPAPRKEATKKVAPQQEEANLTLLGAKSEEVEEIRKEAELNDLMFGDPLAYEEYLHKESDNLKRRGDELDV